LFFFRLVGSFKQISQKQAGECFKRSKKIKFQAIQEHIFLVALVQEMAKAGKKADPAARKNKKKNASRARTATARTARRSAILEAARSLFFEKGFQSTSVESIMERAELSTGTFYLYFANKIEVYKTLLDQGIVILEEMLKEAFALPVQSHAELLGNIIKTYHEFFVKHRQYFEIIAILSLSSKELRERESKISRQIDEKNLALLKSIERVILNGIKSGEFRQCNAWETACALWGIQDGLILLEERNNTTTVGVSLKALSKCSTDLILRGLINRA
jgi:AcrR family transcriptional regulator